MEQGIWAEQLVAVEEQSSKSRARRWIGVAAAILGTLGVLGAVGTYYVPGLLDRLGAAATDRLPLQFDVIEDRTPTANYVFPANVAASGALYDALAGFDSYESARRHGGVLADEEDVRVVLWGRHESVVHIDDIRVRVASRSTPRNGWYNANQGCGGPVDPRILQVDFDKKPTVAAWLIEGRPALQPSFTISSSDEEVIDVKTFTSHDEVTWTLDIKYHSPDGSGTLTVDDHGKPFRITTVKNAQGYVDRFRGKLVHDPKLDGRMLSADDHPVC